MEAFARRLGVTVEREPMRTGSDGFYDHRERRIAINPAIAVNQQAAALAHELAHALVRLDHQPVDAAMDYATEELVAESVALTVCGFLGLDRRQVHPLPGRLERAHPWGRVRAHRRARRPARTAARGRPPDQH